MKIKIPSISQIGRALLDIGIRFPSSIIVTIVGTIFALIWIEHSSEIHINVIFTCLLGLPFTLALTLLAERYASSNGVNTPSNFGLKIAVQIIGLVLLTFYYLSLPYHIDNAPYYIGYRLVLFIIAAHFAVAIAPFVGISSLRGFWRYNQMLFIRFLTAVLYSATLFVGLSIAILAIEKLFNVNFGHEIYAKLFIVLAGIFNTFFFLYGIPRNLELFESDNPYPWGLKLFTQYVLLPLVTIYLLILYAYTTKIIAQWHLPEGWVSYLVLCFSVAGILSLLLVWPLRDNEEYDWVRWYSRGYFIALVPLIILLFVAVSRRITDYGITINRYLLIVLSLWLAGITLYFIFSRIKNIKAFPLSLFLVALFSAFGPWGAFYISQKSQLYQLKHLLANNKMLNAENQIVKASHSIPVADNDRIRSIINYLYYTHGPDVLSDIGAKQFVNNDTIPTYMWADTFMSEYGIIPTTDIPQDVKGFYTTREGTYNIENNKPINVWISDFSAYWSKESETSNPPQTKEFIHQKQPYTLKYDGKTSVISLSQNSNTLWSVSIDTTAQRIKQKYNKEGFGGQVPTNEMALKIDTPEGNSAIIYFNNIDMTKDYVSGFNANVALHIK